jgi:glycosyltransferase involved in cell wall biosynthesis
VTLEQCWHRVPGGTARATLEATRALAERDDIELIGVSARHSGPPEAPWVPSVPVVGLPLPRQMLYESWHYLRRPPVERATGPVDVVHVAGMAMPPRSAPLVVTVHDLGFLHEPEHVTRHGLRFFRRAIDLARREADIVVAPSQATIDDCIAHGFDRGRLRLVPWGVHPVETSMDEVERVRRHHDLHRPYVLFVGTVEPRKNLRTLVEAFLMADMENTDLVIVGPQGWNESLERIGERGRGHIRTLGFVDQADLPAVYKGADVFCLPSLREGFGLPVLEAMSQGTPVITSASTSTQEVLGDAGLVVEPTDARALAEALETMLTDRSLANDLGHRGYERSRDYTWERTAALLTDAFFEAAA